jgi:bacterioferritin
VTKTLSQAITLIGTTSAKCLSKSARVYFKRSPKPQRHQLRKPMAKEDTMDELNITREQMVTLLNEDLAREYQAIIAYVVYSQAIKGAEYTDIARELEKHAAEELTHAIKIAKQVDYLGGTPAVVAKPVASHAEAVDMLHADLENERETVANYRQRIRQAEAMGEFALSETLRSIIAQEQEHEIDLCDALGINVPTPKPAPNGKVEKLQSPSRRG